PRGDDTKKNSPPPRDNHRERDHRKVERHLIETRNGNAIADQHEQTPVAESGDRKSSEATPGAEDPALGQHLTYESAAVCTERRAHADLTRAGGASRQEQIRDVDAGDEQHEHHRYRQRDDRRADLADHLFLYV